MSSSIYLYNLSEAELDIYIKVLKSGKNSLSIKKWEKLLGEGAKQHLISLVYKGFLIKEKETIKVPDARTIVRHFLQQEYRLKFLQTHDQSEENFFLEIRNYLSAVQKHIAKVETESRKAFLNLRTMVDKITDQGKDQLNFAFNKALDRNTEIGEWVSIPHISPVGLYEPIEELKEKFNMIINELEHSLKTLMTEFSQLVFEEIENVANTLKGNKDIQNLKTEEYHHKIDEAFNKVKHKLESKQEELLEETRNFSDEVLIALHEQINLLEKNLGKDLMEQFDAIERLNDLKPERVWIMLEELRTELLVSLNNYLSRILREINTLQLEVDFSKTSLILTNEAGKALKKVEEMQKQLVRNFSPLKDILEELED